MAASDRDAKHILGNVVAYSNGHRCLQPLVDRCPSTQFACWIGPVVAKLKLTIRSFYLCSSAESRISDSNSQVYKSSFRSFYLCSSAESRISARRASTVTVLRRSSTSIVLQSASTAPEFDAPTL
ncbi:hypothetical protein PSHT_10810 [Puccinia striiformis]|uniref:Uncharacterized protein n=2 Tax=Puccinia striiformis TaxID=27350 RepID=A0A2S4V754_9BASI|nr:hypothetical protein H4Q26_003066 [Puccinia striiformis f. sp. tritici PST-130]POW05366.1 hypothetical protein PSHT_10810 [Puccinia striiformis]POW12458.1 hypothetical protein PSTT_04470 [Puccinia striiformis]